MISSNWLAPPLVQFCSERIIKLVKGRLNEASLVLATFKILTGFNSGVLTQLGMNMNKRKYRQTLYCSNNHHLNFCRVD